MTWRRVPLLTRSSLTSSSRLRRCRKQSDQLLRSFWMPLLLRISLGSWQYEKTRCEAGFPFAKKRLVLADLKSNDIILCQITSQSVNDEYVLPLDNSGFSKGSLRKPSNIRPNRLFTAEKISSPGRSAG